MRPDLRVSDRLVRLSSMQHGGVVPEIVVPTNHSTTQGRTWATKLNRPLTSPSGGSAVSRTPSMSRFTVSTPQTCSTIMQI